MSELDKLFKDKLSNREFEFKDAYWDAAEQLIEQQEGRKSRGVGWWRWGGLLLLLLSFGLGYFMFKNNTEENLKTNQNSTNIGSNLLNTTDVSTTELIPDIEETPEEQLVGEGQLNLTDLNGEQPSEISTNDAISDLNKTRSTLSTQHSDQKAGSTSPEISNYNSSNVSNNFIKKGTQEEASSSGKNLIPSLRDKPSTNLLIDTFLQQKVDTLDNVKEDMAIDIPVNENTTSTLEKEAIVFEGILPTLKTKGVTLENADPECKGCFDLEELSLKHKKLKLGLVGEGVVFSKKANEELWTAGSFGGFAEYHLKRAISFRTGLQYTIMNGAISSSDDGAVFNGTYDPLVYNSPNGSSEDQYSFGLRTVQKLYLPNRFHYIDMPIVFQWRKKRHALEAGAQVSLLLAAKGTSIEETSLFPWEQDELELTDARLISNNTQAEWLPSDTYKQFTTSFLLGYDYQVSSRFSVHLNTQFTAEDTLPIGPSRSAALNSEEKISILERGRFQFRIGTKWYLN